MKGTLLVCAAATAAPSAALAQLGELHFGVIGGYGIADSYRGGAGLSIAVVPGRIGYAGARYVYHWGSTITIPGDAADFEILTWSQTLAADLGLQFPFGRVELVIGASLGVVRFQQRLLQLLEPEMPSKTMEAWEFLVAPSLTAYFRAGRFLIAPEFQWGLAGDPDFPVDVSHRGPAFYLRLVLPFEIDRIRH